MKKEFAWIQPPTLRGKSTVPEISMNAILQAAMSVSEAEIKSWDDIDRLDIQPSRGIVKVQSKNRFEIQVDLKTAEVLQTAYRRSDLIETLHDGSWFHDRAKIWFFLPVGILVLGLWLTGIYLFILPHQVRWSRRRKAVNTDRSTDAHE